MPDLFSGPRPTRRPSIQARQHAVAAGHPLAALAAQRILDRGGNAADAGVAAGICIDVLLPDLVSLGGVAPIIYYEASSERVETISGLGRWPRAATTDTVKDPATGHMARDLRCCVTPAAVDAWLLALERYGTMRLADVTADAIDLCEHGFVVYDVLAASIALHAEKLARHASSAAVFSGLGVGDVLRQPDLARTLRRLVAAEADGSDRVAGLRAARDLFYRGEIAHEIASYMRENGGFMTREDLADFHVQVEPPIKTTYRGYELYGCGAWCQGPVLPIALNILERYDVVALGHNSAAYVHLLTEALKAAFSDREHYVADPEHVDVPIDELLSKERGARWRALIDPRRAMPGLPPRLPISGGVCPSMSGVSGPPAVAEAPTPPDTSYVCVVDRDGNVFSATPSDGFTEVPIVPGLGFVVSPRGTQAWVDPSHSAFVAPGKRPRLTPAPYILFKDGRPIMPFGTPGADVQPQAMLQLVLNAVDFGMEPQAAVEAPRFATYSMPITADPHPCQPNVLRAEARIGAETLDGLAALGHDVRPWPDWHPAAGSLCAIWIDRERGTLTAGADPRRVAYAIGW